MQHRQPGQPNTACNSVHKKNTATFGPHLLELILICLAGNVPASMDTVERLEYHRANQNTTYNASPLAGYEE